MVNSRYRDRIAYQEGVSTYDLSDIFPVSFDPDPEHLYIIIHLCSPICVDLGPNFPVVDFGRKRPEAFGRKFVLFKNGWTASREE